ncbi:MAG TPA: tRNA uridine-5-carboxymethylaminomethyl(34) synthesis GTPase MnmE [Tissierellaceae bacterium]
MTTIAAISTAVGEAGIGIVRMSGKNSIDIASKVFKGVNNKHLTDGENRKLMYGHIMDGEKIIDEVLITFMKEPYTYTRENMVEIYCHGGIISVRKVLELLLKSGAVMAEAGEFTKRAFLNGRLDLSQAEAVIDIIKAKTDKSLEVSVNQLDGSLSNKVRSIRDIIIKMMAHIEASIDFPEEDIEDVTYNELLEDAEKVQCEIQKLLDTSSRGKILRDGIKTVILGRPNVGKSSLLNAILNENRAIVTDIPGTTRDIIEEFVNIDGIPLKIIDTAGIRETEDVVEQIGVTRARESIKDADLIISIFDASRQLTEEDYDIIDIVNENNSIVLLNKIDLNSAYDIEKLQELIPEKTIISASVLKEQGIEELIEEIKNMFYKGEVNMDSDIVITNIRHKNQLDKSLANIKSAIEDIKMEVPLDCVEVDLRDCWDNLGEISGDTIGEDVLDRVFKEFCIGK